MGDAPCVPWEEGGNGGTVSQVTVLGVWDEELGPGEWWLVSQGSDGEGGKKGNKGKERKQEQEGGTFRVSRELLFLSREEAGTTGMTGMTRGTRVVTRGRGVTRRVR